MSRAAGLVAVAFLLVAVEAHAADTDREARAAHEFEDGQRAFAAKDYVHAGESFEAAYRDKPHYAPLWNAARSWDRAGETVRAANLYWRYLGEAPPDAPDRDQATAALREISARVARIELHAADVTNVRVDGRPFDGSVIYAAGGEHVAAGDSANGPVRRTFLAESGRTTSVTLTPPAKEKPAPPPGPLPDDAGRKPLPPIVAVLGAALTIGAGGLTMASGFDTVSKKHTFLDDPTQPSRLDDAVAAQTRTNVLLGTTLGVALVTGVVAVFFTDWKRGRR